MIRVLSGHPWHERHGRVRPLCATCHGPAQWAIQEIVPSVRIKPDGTTIRSDALVHTYYCTTHIKEQS